MVILNDLSMADSVPSRWQGFCVFFVDQQKEKPATYGMRHGALNNIVVDAPADPLRPPLNCSWSVCALKFQLGQYQKWSEFGPLNGIHLGSQMEANLDPSPGLQDGSSNG